MRNMADFYEYSTPEIVRLLGARFKEYRIRCNLTQKDVSEQLGLPPSTNSRMVQQAIFHCPHLSCC